MHMTVYDCNEFQSNKSMNCSCSGSPGEALRHVWAEPEVLQTPITKRWPEETFDQASLAKDIHLSVSHGMRSGVGCLSASQSARLRRINYGSAQMYCNLFGQLRILVTIVRSYTQRLGIP